MQVKAKHDCEINLVYEHMDTISMILVEYDEKLNTLRDFDKIKLYLSEENEFIECIFLGLKSKDSKHWNNDKEFWDEYDYWKEQEYIESHLTESQKENF